jgi:DNA-binding SARP family transcriptional activator/TolB-like protein/Tfp pilus assembly protein PilF
VIRLRTLGALHLYDSEGRESNALLARPKRLALLAYLALALPRGPHRRDTLISLFWPEQDTERARNALSQSVHVVRRALGADAVVSANGDALGLDPRVIWCDAVAFEQALEGGHVADALDLYRGELLEGFHVPAAPDFERWLDAERARLRGRYVNALESLAKECEARRDFNGAVIHWRRLAACDLYSSRVALRVMRALAAAGDPAAAVQHARMHESLLRDELDVAPDSQVGALVRQLQAANSTATGTTTADPSARADLTGAPPAAAPDAVPTPSRLSIARRHHRAAFVVAGVFALLVAGVAVALANSRREAAITRIRSIGVLPLVNISGDAAQQAFADGMHDALITELGRHPELSVISRTSMLGYRGSAKALPVIARELKVDGLVEGTLVWEGGRVRMNVQLVHGPSDRHVWAKSYTRDLRDVLSLQGELADAIAREVRVASTPFPRSRRGRAGPKDSLPNELHVWELYQRGRHAELSGSRVGFQTAMAAYRQAINLDSTFALGYAGLAVAYTYAAEYAYVPVRPALDTARMFARRAVTLDSTNAETRSVLALILGDAGDYEAAEREFRRAIELGPSNPRAHYRYSILLVALGRGEDALRESNRAIELDPFGPQGVRTMQRFAQFLATGERAWLKVPIAKRRSPVLGLEPGQSWAIASDAVFAAEQGQCDDARTAIERAQQLTPDNIRMLHYVAAVYWSCGERVRARSILDQMERQPSAREHGYYIAIVHSIFGNNNSAFLWLERTEWLMGRQAGLRAYRWLDPLRADPRYARLLDRLGLPHAAQNASAS